ncbi:hypothetical protein [Microbacterium proteolyticum]|uniref:hypothetical protein n=1 Tax=Microbacterium proteolyticum TaxID=1572644 RepID=UPI0035BFEE3E
MTHQLDREVSFAAVELLNTWARFSRTMYFSVCRGVRGADGLLVKTTVKFADFDSAQRHAAQHFRKKPLHPGQLTHRDEPNWLEPTVLQKLLHDIGSTNAATIDAALSVPTRVFQGLPPVRNFYGHRGQDTARKASNVGRQYQLSGSLHPTELCLSFAPNRPQSILRDWTFDLRTIMRLAAA